MAALNPDRTLDFCSANDQNNVEIHFVDEDHFPLINIMEHRASEEEFYSDDTMNRNPANRIPVKTPLMRAHRR